MRVIVENKVAPFFQTQCITATFHIYQCIYDYNSRISWLICLILYHWKQE